MRMLLVGWVCLTLACKAAEIQAVNGELRIPQGKTRTVEFGTVPQNNTTVLLDITSRLDSEGLGGSMYFMKLELNGRLIIAARSRKVGRLRNRKLVSPVAPRQPYSWFGNNSWRVLYAPDFKSALKQTYYEGNPHRLLLDVTDLTNPAAENRLKITNMATTRTAKYSKRGADLVIKTLTVRTLPEPSATMTAAGDVDGDVINRGTPGAGPAAYRGKLLAGGGFTIDVRGRRFGFASAMSYPNAGLNHLAAATRTLTEGQPGWQRTVTPTADGGTVVGVGPDYRLERTVRFTDRKVEVTDRFVNRHLDAKLGLLVENTVSLRGMDARVRLGGNPDPAMNSYYANGNPSVYATIGEIGLGLICEDDVFRNQARLFYDADRECAGLRTEMLCLQPGGSYTLRWSVYPVASNDYFDFVNLVRVDWGSNYTVQGAWCFFNPDTILTTPVEEIRRAFGRLGIRYACYCGGWVDRKHDRKRIGFGTGVMDSYWADFRRRLREAATRIREAVPGCKVLVYYDTQRDTSDGGHGRFRDSWLTSVNGDQFSTEWSGVYSLTWSMVATRDNTFGKAMLDVVDRYVDEIGVDGLYWDEMEAVGYGTPLITHNTADGYSCILNKKTYTIEREIGITTLLGEGHRMAVIDRIRARGGMVMGNGPTTTKDLLAKRVQRMVEVQHNDYWCYQGNLDTPLGYASSRMDFGNWIRALQKATLLVGTRYTYEHEISRYVFPFTPIELHAGYLLGEERIIAGHSGNFGWPGQQCLVQAHHFDRDGKRTNQTFRMRIGAEARTTVTVKPGEAVILERLPVSIVPVAGGEPAEIRDLTRVGADIRFVLDCPPGCTIRITNAGAAYRVFVNTRELDLTRTDGGDAFAHVPPGLQHAKIHLGSARK